MVVGLQDFLNALVSHGRFGIGIRHFRELLHGLIHLAQILNEQHHRTDRERTAQGQASAKPKHQTGSNSNDKIDQRHESGLQAASAKRGFNLFQAGLFQPDLLVSLPGKGFHYANGGEHLLHHGNDFALLFSYLAGRALDAARVCVNHDKKWGRHGKRNQRESPVDPQHHANHAHQRDHIDEGTEQSGVDKALDIVHVTDNAADEVAGPLLVVEGQRQPLYVRIQGPPQIVGHPLPYSGGEVFLGISRNRVQERDGNHRQAGEFHHRQLVSP